MRRLYVMCSMLLVAVSASADLPRPESFIVAGIRFGDSFEQVQEISQKLGFQLVLTQRYLPIGIYGVSPAFQRFEKPCSDCTRDPSDPRRESHLVQYSRITGVVVAIGRNAPIDPPVVRSSMEIAIIDRFGKENSWQPGAYWWTPYGLIDSNPRCQGGGLPDLYGKKGCGVAANYWFRTAEGQPQLAIQQSVYVYDWATHEREFEQADDSQKEVDRRKLEESKGRAVPHL